MSQTNANGATFMEKLSTFIVDKRNLIFLITIIGLIFSAFSRNWVQVENDLTFYLPDNSQTKQALAVMDEQFVTYGTAEVMVANVTPAQAQKLADKLRDIEGVQSLTYDKTTDHYNDMSALFSITFAYDEEGRKTQKAREDAAKERIFSILPEDQKNELIALFDEFEDCETSESKYAHAMDNLQPLLLNHSNNGDDWKQHQITSKQVYGRQSKTKLGSERLYEITDHLIQDAIKKGFVKE